MDAFNMRDTYYIPAHYFEKPLQTLLDFFNEPEPLLMVLGDAGTCKSRLLRVFQRMRLTPEHTLALKGRDALTPDKLYQSMCQAWDLECKRDIPNQAAFTDLVLELNRFSEPALLVIDASDQLPLATLAAILHLCFVQPDKQPHMRIILFGCPTLKQKLNSLHHPDVSIKEMHLPVLSLEETRQFLQDSATHHHIHPSVLSDEMVTEIYQTSGGVVKDVARLAEQTFANYHQVPRIHNSESSMQENPDNHYHASDSEDPHPLNHVEAVSKHGSSRFDWKDHWIKMTCVVLLAFVLFLIYYYEKDLSKTNQNIATPTAVTKPIANNPKPVPKPTPKPAPMQTAQNTQVSQSSIDIHPSESEFADIPSGSTPAPVQQPVATPVPKAVVKAQSKPAPVHEATPTVVKAFYRWQLSASINRGKLIESAQSPAYRHANAYVHSKQTLNGTRIYTLNIGNYKTKNEALAAWKALPASIQKQSHWLTHVK